MKTIRCNPRPAWRAAAASMALLLAAIIPNTPNATAADVGGLITSNTTWAAADSPVLVTSNLEVAPGVTLSIEPGVLVRFAVNRGLTIRGSLLVNGTATQAVIFTDARDDEPGGDLNGDGNATSPAPGAWGGIRFMDGASGDLRHAEIRHAGYLGQWFALWHQGDGTLTLSGCRILDTAGTGAWLRNSSGGVTISDCEFTRCNGNGLTLDNSPASLSGNSYTTNTVGLLVENAGSPLNATGSFFAGNSTAGAAASNSAPVDARHSWWGHSTGPQHADNPDGLGDPAGAGVLFDPWDDGIPRALVALVPSPSEGGTVAGGGTFPVGNEITVSAIAAAGYAFSGWFDGDTGVSAAADYTFIVAGDLELTARFVPLDVEFTIAATFGTGGFLWPYGDVKVLQGGEQYFAVYPEFGHEIEDLIIDGVSQGPMTGYYFTNVQANHSIHVTFREATTGMFQVAVASNEPELGAVTGGGSFAAGSAVTVTAIPATGAGFVKWTENGVEVSTDPQYTFTINGDRSLLAHFQLLSTGRTFSASYASGPSLNIPRNAPVQRAIIGPDGRALVICGTTSNYVSLGNSEWFNPADNTFTTLAMNSIHGSSPVVVQLTDGRHLIAGGDSNLGVPSHAAAEIFDPVAGTFTSTGAMQQVRASASGIRLTDGRVLVAGAWYRSYANTAEIYNPATATFSQLASLMSEARTRPALLPRADGKVLVIGGYAPYNGAPLQSVDLFDPATDTFSALSSGIPLPADGVNFSTRHDYCVELPDSTWLVMGHAVNGSAWQPRAMIYNPADGTFTPTSAPPAIGFYSGPQWLPDPGVAVCTTIAEGGVFGVLVFDPTSGSFHVPAETITLPTNHTMGGNSGLAVLPDSSLLVTGGTERTGGQFNFGAISNTLRVTIEAAGPPPPPPPPPPSRWVRQTSGTSASLASVYFADDQTGWVGGGDWASGTAVLLKTNDAGATWQSLEPGPGSSVEAIRFLDPLNGWILVNTYGHMDSSSSLRQTSDGGETWTTRFSATNLNLNCIHFLDSLHGWAAGAAIIRTTDGGLTWSTYPLAASHQGNDIIFTDVNNGWLAGSDSENWAGLILKSTDGGQTWLAQSIHDAEEMGHVFQLVFHNATDGTALGGHGVMLETSNGGADWHPVAGLPFGHPQKIAFPGDGTAWMAGSWWGWDLGPPYPEDAGYSLMGSTDGGATWSPDQGAASRDVWLADIHFPSANHGWAVGDTGVILKFTAGATPSGYDAWAQLHFTQGEIAASLHLPDADPGNLGIPNLTRYALGLGARSPRRDWLPQPHPGTTGAEGFAIAISLPDPSPPDVAFLLGASATLQHWSEYPMEQWVIDHEWTADGRRNLVVRPPATPGDGHSLFLNLIIRRVTP
jgi:photosystem II stability/assembly factor-like uncharacterized protein